MRCYSIALCGMFPSFQVSGDDALRIWRANSPRHGVPRKQEVGHLDELLMQEFLILSFRVTKSINYLFQHVIIHSIVHQIHSSRFGGAKRIIGFGGKSEDRRFRSHARSSVARGSLRHE